MKFKPFQLVVSCYFWFELFFISAIMFSIAVLIWLITLPFDPRRYILHKFTCFWSAVVFFLNPMWRARFEGKEKIDRKTTYVIVSNHASGADILVLFKLYTHFKWVAKRTLFYFPFIGWNMLLCQYILIERGRRGSVRRMMDKAIANIADHNSVLIFPEGTRSKDGHLQPFKTGAFQLALDTGVPILPVVIRGTHHAIQKGGFLIHRNRNIKATILDPIPYDVFKGHDARDVAILVHNVMNERM